MHERRKLIRVHEFGDILGWGYRVEGTRLYVVEFVTFGFDYASYYLLLRAPALIARLADPDVRSDLSRRPTRYGRRLEFGPDLERDPASPDVYYVGKTPDADLEPPTSPP